MGFPHTGQLYLKNCPQRVQAGSPSGFKLPHAGH
jgi:hypothetical protein